LITFTLTQEEATAIYRLVGQLPTSSNAHPLFVKLGEQMQGQIEPVAQQSE
jgi:hypothetical protein